MEERQQELNQLKEVEEKNLKELTNNERKLASLKAEIEKFGNLDDSRIQWEDKCMVWFLNPEEVSIHYNTLQHIHCNRF